MRITKMPHPVQMEQSSMLKYSGTPNCHEDILTYFTFKLYQGVHLISISPDLLIVREANFLPSVLDLYITSKSLFPRFAGVPSRSKPAANQLLCTRSITGDEQKRYKANKSMKYRSPNVSCSF